MSELNEWKDEPLQRIYGSLLALHLHASNDLSAFQQRIQTDSLPPLLQLRQKRISASRVGSHPIGV